MTDAVCFPAMLCASLGKMTEIDHGATDLDLLLEN